MTTSQVPAYGTGTLADLSSSVAASAGVPGFANALGLPELPRVCVLLVDGLGWELLRAHADDAPFLSSLAGRPLSAGFPSTTVTSLSSLGTGLPPGEHGMFGYQVALPGEGRLLNCLRWDDGRTDPSSFQAQPTVYQRANAAGVRAAYVAAGAYYGTGFNEAITRGSHYVPADSLGQLVACAAAALDHPRAHVTVYHSELDSTGHLYGAGSTAWRYQLKFVDLLAEQLVSVLPAGTALYVTADHGMTNPADLVDFDAEPSLSAGVAMLGGEPRARHVYAEPGAAGDVLAAWRSVLGDRAWVVSRAEAVEAGWFGPVAPALLARIGDVVAVPHTDLAIVARTRDPLGSTLIGMHGSMVPAEQLVPMLAHERL